MSTNNDGDGDEENDYDITGFRQVSGRTNYRRRYAALTQIEQQYLTRHVISFGQTLLNAKYKAKTCLVFALSIFAIAQMNNDSEMMELL
eukprot:5114799-Ditylum_brightwellii.AAC.1